MTPKQTKYLNAEETRVALMPKVAKSKALKRQLLRDLSKEVAGKSGRYLASIDDDNETYLVQSAISYRAHGTITEPMRRRLAGIIK